MKEQISQKTKKRQNEIERIAVCAFLAACSIVAGKIFAINVTDFIRLSFENFPLLLAGFYFGPLAGAAVGIVADITGCLLVGYAINPIITLGAALIGTLAGIFGMIRFKNRFRKVLFVVIPAHLVGSVFVKTAGLVLYYSYPFLPTFGWRFLTYTLISAAEIALLYTLTSHRAFDKEMRKCTSDEEREKRDSGEL